MASTESAGDIFQKLNTWEENVATGERDSEPKEAVDLNEGIYANDVIVI